MNLLLCSTEPKVGRVVINYTIKAKQWRGRVYSKSEKHLFFDIKAPNFLFEPLTPEDSNQFISIEAGIPFYDDDSGCKII